MRINKSKVIDIIGAPISIASPEKGASLGPDAIRIAGLKASLNYLGLEYSDMGNQNSLEEPFPPKHFEPGTIKYLDEIHSFLLTLKERVVDSFSNGHFPLILGGDHSLAMGSLAAASQYYKAKGQKFGVIWFDAHADYNTEESSPSGNIHGMPLAVATGKGNEKLLSIFENNFIDPRRTVIMGVRSVDSNEGKLIDEVGIQVFTMKDIDEMGMLQCTRQAIKIASPDKSPIHLSFDIDGLDAGIIPGTGTPVMGGITLREAHLMLELISETGLLQSMDMVEVNPILDNRNQTANVARHLLESALGKVIF